jgi:hypothetical protein
MQVESGWRIPSIYNSRLIGVSDLPVHLDLRPQFGIRSSAEAVVRL